MPSKEWSELRETFAACAPKAIAATMAAVRAINPEIDLGGADRFYGLTKEPTDVTYEEVTAAGLPAIWANALGYDRERVLVYFHGGGFVSGSKDSYRKIAAHLAKAAGVRTLIPDYRLAPMNPFPAQLEDARSLYDWLLAQGYQPSKIAFAGDSAGGNIATGAALALNRDGAALPGAVVAFSPWYDMEANGPTFDSNAAVDVAISRQLVHTFAPMFLGGQSPADPLANPLYADPAGLPPLLLTCGGDETLRDSELRDLAEEPHPTACDARRAYVCSRRRPGRPEAVVKPSGRERRHLRGREAVHRRTQRRRVAGRCRRRCAGRGVCQASRDVFSSERRQLTTRALDFRSAPGPGTCAFRPKRRSAARAA